MANIKQCDRCMKTYKRILDIRTFKITRSGFCIDGKDVDLCNDCYEKFYRWMMTAPITIKSQADICSTCGDRRSCMIDANTKVESCTFYKEEEEEENKNSNAEEVVIGGVTFWSQE